MSPLFDAGHLILHVGGHPSGALLALSPENGEEIWRYDGEGPGYSSPIVVHVDGSRQIVTQAHRNIISVDADSGRLLWSYPSVTPCNQNIVTPLRYRDTVIFSSQGAGVFALRPQRTENAWTVTRTWHNETLSLYMSSPVLVGDLFVGFSPRRRGQLFALDPRSGEERWASAGKQGEHAALVGSADRLLMVKSTAEWVTLETDGTELIQAGEAMIGDDAIWTHPVPVPDGWLVRDSSGVRLLRYQAPRALGPSEPARDARPTTPTKRRQSGT